MVAAASSLADHPQLLDRIAPSDQTFAERDYAGVFRFNFYVYGRWIEVVVDDRLPTDRGRMVYVHSSQPNEFWGALLEKAFAKYKNLILEKIVLIQFSSDCTGATKR